MSCNETRRFLDDFVDGVPMDAPIAADVRRHLERCEDCRAEERSLRDLVDRASRLPGSIEPARDLWPAISDRLEARRPRTNPAAPPSWAGLVAASLLLVLVTGGIGWGLLGTAPSSPAPGAPESTAALAVPARSAAASDLDVAERTLLRAKLQLIDVLESRRESMSPDTAATIDRNMRVMEKAVEEIREALERDPGNAELNRMLMAAHQRELDLLERVTTRAAGL